ncbi:DNA polymerase III subunit alpha [Parvicella tangerina]|uniref:DNA-directed DNA polymerase n=1 Tax=Parvicella tangerina TaxID=2829795 RepID=A0A916JQU1_9FLAO|nr:DNA polymerase III subunit alpha [Parvicella tangerina]CAG5087244.1 Error-prone DNA polymerase [Parvicella tangerina]
MYVNTHTYYSLRYGTLSPDRLLSLAAQAGVEVLAVTDINNTSAAIKVMREAKNYNLQVVPGIDFRNGVKQLFVAIPENNEGFEEINSYLTPFLQNKTHVEGGVVEIPPKAPNFKHVKVIYPYQKGGSYDLAPHEYIGIEPKDLDYIRIKKVNLEKGVILQTVTFQNKKDFNAHRLLRAIDKNTLLSKLPKSEQGEFYHRLLPLERLLALYEDYPAVIANTKRVLQSAVTFDFSENATPQNQQCYGSSHEEDEALLLRLCEEGMTYRYDEVTPEIEQRLLKEVDTIKKMGFISYFLINWDIVKYARSQGYYYVGRGSGANSLVAYLLRITDVDPIELDLYFERFINLYRLNPPDFDIDFSWRDRDDMTRYIFERFKNVALVATFNTFQYRSMIRELGKVFGMPKMEIDKLISGTLQPWEYTELSDLVMKYSRYIHGFPSHLSIHASGIIIAEKSINYFSPTFMPPKGYPTVQFDMHLAEDVKLFKFDILSQRGLGKIKDALTIIKANGEEQAEIDIHDMRHLKQDERIKKMLREADAIGCFYVESPAMRMLLRKLEVEDYLGLVAASSVIRPGVAQSGMMQTYIQRTRKPEKRKEAHPVLLNLMPETFGVMVYQEDVIKVAYHFAGLSLGEADKMRRGMSGKYRSRDEFEAVKQKFFHNCIHEKGHSKELTAEVWRQTESFAGYAFAKGHSASYAVESYQSLYLKAYYPLAYMVATINNYGGFYRTELYVHEAKMHGGIIHTPCVNKSTYETCLEGKNIYLGFHLLHSFDLKTAARIEQERNLNGGFTSFNDFLDRVSISLEQITILIRINAFRFTGVDKRTLLWEAHFKLQKSSNKIPETALRDLFRIERPEYQIPELENSWQEDAFDQMELLSFSLYSPFQLIDEEHEERQFIPACELSNYVDQIVWVRGYLIHRKRTSTKGGDEMFFGTFLDENGAWLDTVHFPKIARAFPFRGPGVYEVKGKIVEDFGCYTVEAELMEKSKVMEDPRYTEVRDEEKEKKVVTRNRRIDYWA